MIELICFGRMFDLTSIPLPPSASALVHSLRGVGYSLQTAIADLIDNSITAGASRVEINPDWNNGRPVVAILDDGCGMDEATLIEAMRFGCGGPEAPRTATDLGRFGLGLKTASLSQARRLTVASIRGTQVSAFRWDIDHMAGPTSGWELLKGFAPEAEHRIKALLEAGRGTLVLWENIDFGRKAEAPNAELFARELRSLEHHVGMVFHRFLDRGGASLRLSIAGQNVRPWDPFLEDHDPPSDPVGSDVIRTAGGPIKVAGFVMPHPGRFRNEAERTSAGGPEGWNAHQGFYIYRGERLLTFGGWMGLGRGKAWTREEASRLARIRIDIPPSADADWQIDVKKSVARPPASARSRLERLAESVRAKAREVYVHRGPRGARRSPANGRSLWRLCDSHPRYRVDRTHPVVQAAQLDPAAVSDLLDLIERTLPIERIWLDRSESGAPPETDPEIDPILLEIAVATVRRRIARGEPLQEAVATVATSEPFGATSGIAELMSVVLKEDLEGN